jgi:O-succinylbenzoic acid--CoA ligase
MNKHPMSYRVAGKRFSEPEILALAYEKLSVLTTPQWERDIWSFITQWFSADHELEVTTSGSTGNPKTVSIKKDLMRASARATLSFLELKPGHTALLCLPVKYIAGKMMIVRALEGELDLHFVEPATLPDFDNLERIDFCAMVPMQVKSVLDAKGQAYLERIQKLIIGGGFLLPGLKEKLQAVHTEIWQTYGMTETITHIAMRKLNGKQASEYYAPLPGVATDVDESGCLAISCSYLDLADLQTNDLVEINADGSFKVLGRIDNVVNSGGVKLLPEVIEQKLQGFTDREFYVAGLPDEHFGERPVLYVQGGSEMNREAFYLWKEIEKRLTGYEIPKEIIFKESFEKTVSGKIIRD